MFVKVGFIYPQGLRWKFQKYLWNHQLVYVTGWTENIHPQKPILPTFSTTPQDTSSATCTAVEAPGEAPNKPAIPLELTTCGATIDQPGSKNIPDLLNLLQGLFDFALWCYDMSIFFYIFSNTYMGVSLNGGFPPCHTPKWWFLVRKNPWLLGNYHHFRKHPT